MSKNAGGGRIRTWCLSRIYLLTIRTNPPTHLYNEWSEWFYFHACSGMGDTGEKRFFAQLDNSPSSQATATTPIASTHVRYLYKQSNHKVSWEGVEYEAIISVVGIKHHHVHQLWLVSSSEWLVAPSRISSLSTSPRTTPRKYSFRSF